MILHDLMTPYRTFTESIPTAFSIDRNCDKNLMQARGAMSTKSTIGNGGNRLEPHRLRAGVLGESAEMKPLTSIANGRFLQEGE